MGTRGGILFKDPAAEARAVMEIGDARGRPGAIFRHAGKNIAPKQISPPRIAGTRRNMWREKEVGKINGNVGFPTYLRGPGPALEAFRIPPCKALTPFSPAARRCNVVYYEGVEAGVERVYFKFIVQGAVPKRIDEKFHHVFGIQGIVVPGECGKGLDIIAGKPGVETFAVPGKSALGFLFWRFSGHGIDQPDGCCGGKMRGVNLIKFRHDAAPDAVRRKFFHHCRSCAARASSLPSAQHASRTVREGLPADAMVGPTLSPSSEKSVSSGPFTSPPPPCE